MGAAEVERFLTHLAVRRRVAASTQNQALNALLFLYEQALRLKLGELSALRARRTRRLPVLTGRTPRPGDGGEGGRGGGGVRRGKGPGPGSAPACPSRPWTRRK
jgi:Phage integrase, N-terminal SAM-like domain